VTPWILASPRASRGAAGRLVGAAGLALLAPAARALTGPRELAFVHLHTNEELQVVYRDDSATAPAR
jgi:hypothetical protein